MMMLTIILIRNTTIVITTDTGQHLSLLETFYLMEMIYQEGFYITTGKTCHTVMHVTQILLVHKAPNEGIDCSVISMEFYLIR